jgi:hypothetical protein
MENARNRIGNPELQVIRENAWRGTRKSHPAFGVAGVAEKKRNYCKKSSNVGVKSSRDSTSPSDTGVSL